MILGDTILETRGLTKEFKGFTAVNGVNLRVRRGSIHALIGPNGAGKTTCFNLLTKFLNRPQDKSSSTASTSRVSGLRKLLVVVSFVRFRFLLCSRI